MRLRHVVLRRLHERGCSKLVVLLVLHYDGRRPHVVVWTILSCCSIIFCFGARRVSAEAQRVASQTPEGNYAQAAFEENNTVSGRPARPELAEQTELDLGVSSKPAAEPLRADDVYMEASERDYSRIKDLDASAYRSLVEDYNIYPLSLIHI